MTRGRWSIITIVLLAIAMRFTPGWELWWPWLLDYGRVFDVSPLAGAALAAAAIWAAFKGARTVEIMAGLVLPLLLAELVLALAGFLTGGVAAQYLPMLALMAATADFLAIAWVLSWPLGLIKKRVASS